MKLQNQNHWAPESPKFLIAENLIVEILFYVYDSCLIWDLNDGYLTLTGFKSPKMPNNVHLRYTAYVSHADSGGGRGS
jgi:hypothetical protein